MVATPPLHVVYNLYDSVPIGWYRIQPAHELAVDTVVLAWLPSIFRQLAAERDYLPSHLPILKRIGAVSPQHVCIDDGLVYIDSVPTASILRDDRRGRQLPSWRACRRL